MDTDYLGGDDDDDYYESVLNRMGGIDKRTVKPQLMAWF